ncbi:MAG: ATP-dependent sacrificial sulfur transferase LarE [Solidesulfovibrio sp. DCME]|uniref:ATP-dependent sacrificial sulfur transferase LarE n=1 Tax=Solidesulfovibrio sp. DCME TaxID=3447380 RepID=UPI003D0D910C
MTGPHDEADGLAARAEALARELTALGRVLVAFSGGVDSTFLLRAALAALGPQNVLAVTLDPPYASRAEVAQAVRLAGDLGAAHEVVPVAFPEALRDNPPERCYLCKRLLFSRLLTRAAVFGQAAVLDGTNRDDLGDHRPGRKALAELGIRSPLLAAGLFKADIRALSRRAGLPTWDKPSAACLLSRLPHGARVDEAALGRIEGGEALLRAAGFPAVRLRLHGDLARIEVPKGRLADLVAACQSGDLLDRLRRLGLRHLTADLAGYTMGSFNEPA